MQRTIVHLIHSGGFYGAERMLLDHCQQVPGKHRVLFLDAPAALLERFRQAGISCDSVHGIKALLENLHAQPGVLNAHNFRAQVYAWIAAIRLRLPLLLTQHGFTPSSLKQRLYTWFSLQLCRTRTVKTVACVARSIALLHEQAGISPGKLVVIPNGLPEASSHRDASPRQLIGFVGRLSHEKGPDLFLDAILPLCSQRPGLHAVMLGGGPLQASLQQRIQSAGLEKQITLPGYQQNIPEWLSRLSVLVISSRTEGTPMILLEAMQAGVPVTSFAVGGIPDVLQNNATGLLVAPEDTVLLGSQVRLLLDDPTLADKLAQRAREHQHQEYNLNKLSERWTSLYNQVQGS
ncbi:glycosyltransferase family 4 protein [Halopseudomonas xiamenensis]|uniref:glycosyltransferase family 4 protein n=1 Tax=Halopseudomonas xiamenensis TaxID=157792 RepID=UPI0016241B4B|nr:glycosyltransferase family 4 protein [Halopseudomonas xiamenensis]